MDGKIVAEGLEKLVEKMELWGEGIIKMLPNVVLAAVIIVLFMALSRWVHKLVTSLFDKTDINESLEQLIANVCRVAVIIAGFIIALAVLQLQKTVFSLLAGVGVIGLALGFAFQDLAANFIAGIMLAVRAPLKIGDVVEINDVQGTVIEVRLRETLIRNFSGQDVFIPNKDFTTNKFTNYSSYGERRIKIEVGVGYEDDPIKAVEVVNKSLKSIDGTLSEPQPAAYVVGLGGSSVNISGFIWLKYPGGDYFQVQNDALIKVKKDLENAGFNIPFPIRTIDLAQGTKETLAQMGQSSKE